MKKWFLFCSLLSVTQALHKPLLCLTLWDRLYLHRAHGNLHQRGHMNKTDTAKLHKILKQLSDMRVGGAFNLDLSTMHNLADAIEAIGKELNQQDK